MSDRRRSPWIAWDSGFYGSTLCDGLTERFGAAGVVIWNAYLCACKRSLVPGQIAIYSDHDALAQLGIQWLNLADENGAAFTLDAVWTYLGRMKHVSRTHRGRATYVTCTHWEAWQQDARSDMEAAKKRRKRAENAATLDADELPKTDTFTDTETLTDTETDTAAVAQPEPTLAVVQDLRILPTEFDAFWARWPEDARQAEAEARKAWKAARGRGVSDVEMLQGLERWVTFWEQDETEAKYIPHPGNWLAKRRWQDNPPVSKPKLSKGEKQNIEIQRNAAEFLQEGAS